MHVYLGADHRGFNLKNEVAGWLAAEQLDFTDMGAMELDLNDDYDDYVKKVVRAMLMEPEGAYGILICGSGQGVCMQANRYKGIRAAYCRSAAEAEETRSHNDANVLCLAADDEAVDYKGVIGAFLETKLLDSEKYARRNRKLDEE